MDCAIFTCTDFSAVKRLHAPRALMDRGLAAGVAGLALRLAREHHGELGALLRLALDLDLAVHRRHDLLHDPQPQPEAAEMARRGRPFEALEDARLVGGRDADAVVLHLE